ncbi:DUF2147 domain-containing protein [Rhodovulum sp. PH10]|uniref:DUF2147 domain-containing protein n=1 Tax=Rhodovulum sp. PH10 TaxID=1187851 RepID=UPI00192CA0FF|nr:DUF2147 domain-containing protein [Rhodovulum sp. PH10]
MNETMRRGRNRCAALAGFLLIATPAVAQDPSPVGEWLVEEGLAKIRIENCSDRLWGLVSWERKSGALDEHNPDPVKKTRPTLGMPILLGMKPTRDKRWEGEIYNSNDGRTYSAKISLAKPDQLRVEGCVLGFLCGGQTWTRVEPPPPAPKGAKPTAKGKPAPSAAQAAPPAAAKTDGDDDEAAENPASAGFETAQDVCAAASEATGQKLTAIEEPPKTAAKGARPAR